MTYTPIVWLLFISALVNGGLAYHTRQYQDVPSVKPFRFMMWCTAIWAFLYGISISLTTFPPKLFFINLIYIPALLSVVASLALALEYTGNITWLTRQRLVLLLIPPVIFVALAFTSQSHQLWRYDYQLVWSGVVPVIVASKGLLYWFYILYMLGVSFASFAVLVTSFRYRTLYFRNTILLTIGMLIPDVVGTLYVLGLTPVRGFDWTSTSFIWTGLVYIWAVLRGRLFDVTPLARNTLIEHIDDLMIVLNRDGLVSDYNRAAQNTLALSPATIGSSPTNLSEPWNGIFQEHAETNTIKEKEVVVSDRTYELDITTIPGEGSNIVGRVFLFRDITRRKQAEVEERKQRILAEALRETSQALNSTLEYDGVLERILKIVGHVVPTDSANICLLSENGTLNYVHFYGYEKHQISKDELATLKFSLMNSLIFKQVAETGEPLIISDTYAYPDWIVTTSGSWIRSYAVMPIRIKEKVVGFLNLDSAVVGMYTPEHLQNLRAFADQVAIAVENARLFDALGTEITERKMVEFKIRYQNDRLNALHAITFELLKHHKLEDLLDVILIRAADLLESPFGLLDEIDGDELVIKATTDMTASLKGLRVSMAEANLSAKTIETREPQVIQDYSDWVNRMLRHDPYQLKAVLNIPISIGENVVGVIALARVQAGKPYTDEEIEVMKSFAQLAALAIDNASLFASAQKELAQKFRAEDELRNANQVLKFQLEAIENLQSELREQAIRDPLTGLYNRRYLTEALEREFARARRESYPISFVMIDIDHFKDINDSFGHPAGDAILQRLATLILSQTRIGDIVCRYGGEEFLVVLPNVSSEIAYQITERWRLSFMGLTLPLTLGARKATISCGISIFPEHGEGGAVLISLADKAMYQAKAAGRNRVIIWSGFKDDDSAQ